MFPTLAYLVHYLTDWSPPLPVPTFGFFMALAFWAAYLVFTLEFRRKQRDTQPPPTITPPGFAPPPGSVPASIDVSRLMDRLLLWCGLIGFAGALLLAKLEDSNTLIHQPGRWLLRNQGLNYYGGLIFGAVTYLVMLRRRGIALTTAADIGSPGMMLAYAVGRLGCHLAGDGDWGIVNRWPQPAWLSWLPDWFWAAHYPHNVLHQGVYLPGCSGDYCSVLPNAVFPTSLYECIVCGLLFGVLWGIRRAVTTPGALFAIYAILIGAERFLIEFIRVTPRHSILGCTLTQAQLISLGWMGIGLGVTGYILTSSAKKAYFYP